MRTSDEIQQLVENELGEIILFKEIAPGAYEAATKNTDELPGFARDHYVVVMDSPVISKAAVNAGVEKTQSPGRS